MLLTIDDFSPHVNTNFKPSLEGQSEINLELIRVEDLNKTDEERQQFNRFGLEFQGPPFYLPQSTYNLTHDVMGQLQIFLVPLGKNDRGFVYQAVFNTFRQPLPDGQG